MLMETVMFTPSAGAQRLPSRNELRAERLQAVAARGGGRSNPAARSYPPPPSCAVLQADGRPALATLAAGTGRGDLGPALPAPPPASTPTEAERGSPERRVPPARSLG